MNTRVLQIADLFYMVPTALQLTENYFPFVSTSDKVDKITSTITAGEIKVSDINLCHSGLVIDDTKELHLYKINEGGYYINLKTKYSETKYECYTSPTWNKVVISKNCLSPDCPPSVIDILMMLVFIYSASYLNTILLHASCIKYGENAVAFIGHSGAGKSTHSRLWLNYIPGTTLLNDDQPAVRVLEDGKIVIYGTPWSGKTPCYVFDKAILKGIIRMKQAPDNKITQLNPVFLFKELLSSCSMIKEDPTTFKLITGTLSKLASHVLGYLLENRPDEEAVRMAYTNTLNSNK